MGFVTVRVTLFCSILNAIGFIFFSMAISNSITFVLVLDAHIQVLPEPFYCSAHQVIPTISTLRWLNLAAAVLASEIFYFDMPALARCITCASVPSIIGALFVFPKRLVGAELRIDRLPSCSFSLELVAGDCGIRSAPVNHDEAVPIQIGS